MRLAAALLLLLPGLARADGFVPVGDRGEFLRLVAGKELRLPFFDITLTLAPAGSIRGQALGYPVTGSWSWREGYFCREMDWSGRAIEYNCQLVEARGEEALRFTVDRGQGRSATFTLE